MVALGLTKLDLQTASRKYADADAHDVTRSMHLSSLPLERDIILTEIF